MPVYKFGYCRNMFLPRFVFFTPPSLSNHLYQIIIIHLRSPFTIESIVFGRFHIFVEWRVTNWFFSIYPTSYFRSSIPFYSAYPAMFLPRIFSHSIIIDSLLCSPKQSIPVEHTRRIAVRATRPIPPWAWYNTHTHTHTHTHKRKTHTHAHAHTHLQSHTHAYMHTRTHAHTSIGIARLERGFQERREIKLQSRMNVR